MTANRRIFWNIVATFSRSLFSLLCGIFGSRWVLKALGSVDYGLYGVIGGFTVIISFINLLLSIAVSRFYAVSVGAAEAAGSEKSVAIEDCQRWFSVAVMLHTIVPIILLLIGYPLGMWAVKNYLVIPPGRLDACVWIFRCVCISCFVNMVSVPFNAMYTAKQYIAELTIYSFATTTLNILFYYFMASHAGDWFVTYGVWLCAMCIWPQVIILIRAICKFEECRFHFKFCFDFSRVKQLFSYAGWMGFGCLGSTVRQQGVAILVNRAFGPSINASMSIANMVNGQTNTFASALVGAFTPAIANAYGAGDIPTVQKMALRTCKFGLILSLLFMLPLMLEIQYVVNLWLGTPPPFAASLCVLAMLMYLIDESTVGHRVSVDASGKLAAYELVSGGLLIATLPLAWWFVVVHHHIFSVIAAMMCTMMLLSFGRVYFGKTILNISCRAWVLRIVCPVVLVSCLTLLVGLLPRIFCAASFGRVVLTTLVCELAFWPLVWGLVLEKGEREFVLEKVQARLARFRGRGGA